MRWAKSWRAAFSLAVTAAVAALLVTSAGSMPSVDVQYGVSDAKGCDPTTHVGQLEQCFYVFANLTTPGIGKVVSTDTVRVVEGDDTVNNAAGAPSNSSGNFLPELPLIFTDGGNGPPTCTGGTGLGTLASPYVGAVECTLPWAATISVTPGTFGWYTPTEADYSLDPVGHRLTDQVGFTWIDLCDKTPNPSTCDAAAQNRVQAPATTTLAEPSSTLVTRASPDHAVAIPADLTDVATLTGVTPDAGGTLTFDLYSDATCSTLVATANATVTGPGSYTSSPITVGAPGSYVWRDSYSGDANNTAIPLTRCGDPQERTLVGVVTPTLTTTASGATTLPATLTDTAHLSGTNPHAGGMIVFLLFSDPRCENEVAGSPVTAIADGSGDYTSPGIPVTAAGTYYWRVAYQGDPLDYGVATGCGDANERTTVSPATPSISTTVSPARPITFGSTVHDTAVLDGATSTAGGTVFYTVYGDPNCVTVLADLTPSPASVVDGVVPPSSPYTLTNVGTYFFVATYSGDSNNLPVASGCAAEPLVLGPSQPALATTASPTTATAPAALFDAASLTGATSTAAGTLTFRLYSDATCSTEVAGSPVAIAVHGNGVYTSLPISAKDVGAYYWRDSYSGDASNAPVPLTACGAAGESTTLTGPAELSICASADNDAAGGTFTFTGTNLTTGESLTPITVRGGRCSAATGVNAGRWKIFEDLGSGLWNLAGTSVQPSRDWLAENDGAGWVKVKVVQGQETQVTFANEPPAATIRVCKYSSSPAFQGTQYSFTVGASKTLTAVAGPRKTTAGCSTALAEEPGAGVKVAEAVPAGERVARITVSPNTTLQSTTGGVARITVGPGENTVYYDNEPAG